MSSISNRKGELHLCGSLFYIKDMEVIMELRIDPEFEGKIPPLTDEEFQQLESNILADGIVINPIIVWDGVIVDGHNRYRIVGKYPHIPFTTREKEFANRYEAIAWICKNQLGRRNLTLQQKKYLIGKQYEAEKAAHGGERDMARDENGQFTASSQIGNLRCNNKTCERIAEENGISKNTVLRAEAFSKAVDIADEIEPGIRSEFLNGSIRATEKEIQALARADPEERPDILAELRKPPTEKVKTAKTEKLPDNAISQLQQISEDMLSAKSRGTQADMLYELEDALDSLMFRWSMCLGNYRDYFADDACRSQINQLVQTGLEYLQQIIK